MLRSFTRLVLGGAQLLFDGAVSLIEELDNEEFNEDHLSPRFREDDFNIEDTTPPSTISKAEESSNSLKFALIGLLFESQELVGNGLKMANNILHSSGEKAEKLVTPLTRNRMARPLYRRFEYLASIGEDKLNQWIELGKVEDKKSREFVRKFINHTTDRGIVAVTTNPDVIDLVEAQSASLANEVVEEVRERTVSADSFFEGILRKILRRPPRSELPAPPLEIRKRSMPLHPKKRQTGKIISFEE